MTAEQCQMVADDAEKWRYGTETLAAKNRGNNTQSDDGEPLHKRDSVRSMAEKK